MNAIQELSKQNAAAAMAIVTIASSLVEGLIKRGVISVDDGRELLGGMVEEIRRDGDEDDGKMRAPSYAIASGIEDRAFQLRK